jgi:flagellar export protein FliJ
VEKGKTQFSDLITIEKNKLQPLQQKLAQNLTQIEQINLKISEIEKDILEIDYPISGTFSMLQQFNIAMHNMKNEIELLKKERLKAMDRVAEAKRGLAIQNREIEKFQFLHEEILKERRAIEKKRESKDLDEIAVILSKWKN